MKQLSLFNEEIKCYICDKKASVMDNDTGSYFCWNCQKEHYELKEDFLKSRNIIFNQLDLYREMPITL